VIAALLGCAAPELPPSLDSAEDPWASVAASARLHLGFDSLTEDAALDDSPSGFTATRWGSGDLRERVVDGPRGPALSFDGVDQFLYVEDDDRLDLESFTVVAWIRADSREDAPEWPILDKYALAAGAWTGYGAWLDGGQPFAGVYAGVTTGTECGGARRGVFDDGSWHLFAARFDGATVDVLVDGERAARCDWTLPPTANTDLLEVGTRGGSYFFRGALDEVTLLPYAAEDDVIAGLL
jgi:hypothetical protein